jgi:hypothetical protein
MKGVNFLFNTIDETRITCLAFCALLESPAIYTKICDYSSQRAYESQVLAPMYNHAYSGPNKIVVRIDCGVTTHRCTASRMQL